MLFGLQHARRRARPGAARACSSLRISPLIADPLLRRCNSSVFDSGRAARRRQPAACPAPARVEQLTSAPVAPHARRRVGGWGRRRRRRHQLHETVHRPQFSCRARAQFVSSRGPGGETVHQLAHHGSVHPGAVECDRSPRVESASADGPPPSLSRLATFAAAHNPPRASLGSRRGTSPAAAGSCSGRCGAPAPRARWPPDPLLLKRTTPGQEVRANAALVGVAGAGGPTERGLVPVRETDIRAAMRAVAHTRVPDGSAASLSRNPRQDAASVRT